MSHSALKKTRKKYIFCKIDGFPSITIFFSKTVDQATAFSGARAAGWDPLEQHVLAAERAAAEGGCGRAAEQVRNRCCRLGGWRVPGAGQKQVDS